MSKKPKKNAGPRGIKPDFDLAKLRKRAEEADRNRSLTQEELARSYAEDADIFAIALEFRYSIEEIVVGICDDDTNFLDSGRKILAKLLRDGVAAAGRQKTRGARKARAAGSASGSAKADNEGMRSSAIESSAGDAVSVNRGSSSMVDFDRLNDDYGSAELYGG